MNPEPTAWDHLQNHAAGQLRPDFADRVLRAARRGVEAAPSIFSQFVLSAATAALCFMAVAFFQSQHGTADSARNLADWQEIAAATADSNLTQ